MQIFRKWLKILMLVLAIMLIAAVTLFGLFWLGYNTPAVYTFLFGDENTRILLAVYDYVKTNQPDHGALEKYLVAKKVKYSFDGRNDQFCVYSVTRTEAVYIQYSKDRISHIEFSPD